MARVLIGEQIPTSRRHTQATSRRKALTAEAFFDTASWIWLYEHFGYAGDYEFIYFE